VEVRRLVLVPGLVLLAVLAAAQEPRWCRNTLLTFDGGSSVLTLRPATGPARAVSFARPAEPVESLLVRDYVLREDGRLLVAAAGVLRGPGGTTNLVLELDADNLSVPAKVRNTGGVACWVVEDAGAGFWCLGPNMPALFRGQDYGVLYRFGDGGGEPEILLKRSQLPRESGQSAWAGAAQLLRMPGGGVLAWMPGVERMARVSGGEARVLELPYKIRRHAVVSVAADGEGVLHALLPLREEEKLDSEYGVFRREGNEWVRVARETRVMRGTRLLGVGGRAALLLDRRLRLMVAEMDVEEGR
jgi:hypothetical protein